MSINSINAAIKPTPEYEEFLQQRTAAMGFQFVLEYFEAHNRSRYVALNQGMISALWTGVIRASSHGTPQNLSPFFVPRRSAEGQLTPNLIGQHLRQTEGQGLDFSEIKLATKQKISLPTDLLSFTHQVKNFHLLLKLIFGDQSILYLRIQTVVDHVQRFEAEYDDRFQANHEFFAEVLSLIDRRVQSFLENCSNCSDVGQIDFTLLGFDSILRSITDGTFVASLPAPLRQAMPRTVTPPPTGGPPPPDSKNKTPSKEKQKRQGEADPLNPNTKRQRGDPQMLHQRPRQDQHAQDRCLSKLPRPRQLSFSLPQSVFPRSSQHFRCIPKSRRLHLRRQG